ncbi:accessory regulator agrBfs protein [Enterococcus sp. 10A9_DIV0425]|uniref:Accessory regulator agrBfs protein n=1 Tax=Candidatus Enterococcus wittei TaxID=1987383 RepID=A0A242K1D2_9ENTE|nr:accessory gene regulator B family protein [Enterococcus sp. 10A9_DIV0425]OTP11272.1 accessory regulator agrBfs protein [Enterococcus sp. 10A9_DIV0425]THE09056.1 accessory regulator AgrB [Enterococcus hirae]
MKNKVVNKLLETLFSGEQDEEDITYIQVKFAIDVLLNNLGKLAVVLVFSIITGSWVETGMTFLSYICVRRYAYGLHSGSEFACLLWTLLYLWGVPLLMKHYQLTISFPWIVILLISCFFLLLRYGSRGTALNPIEPEKRPPLLKKAIFMFLLFATIILFFSNSYFSTYFLLGIVLEIMMLLPVTNYLMNIGGIFYEKNNR